jgi:hypothetical protein
MRKLISPPPHLGFSGLMTKPPGGFVSASMNWQQAKSSHRIDGRQVAKANPSVKNAG